MRPVISGLLALLLVGSADARTIVITAAPPPSAQPAAFTGWNVTAVSLRGKIGTRSSVDCPPRGRFGSVWGSGTYTDDSSICTAAVHAGLIQPANGGRVVFEMRAGQNAYPASTQHGVITAAWAQWHGSYVILTASPFVPPPPGAPRNISWADHASALGNGAYVCPPSGSRGTLWGSGMYTDDSSVCTAAVHAGLITFASGGIVRIELRPGQASYPSTAQHGVRSEKWGQWSGSFVVLGATAPLQIAKPKHP